MATLDEMANRIRVYIWPDGYWLDGEEYQNMCDCSEQAYGGRSDDFTIKYVLDTEDQQEMDRVVHEVCSWPKGGK